MSSQENLFDAGERASRAYEIVCDVVRRRNLGEIIPDDVVLEQYPSLADQLPEILQRAVAIDRIAQRASGDQLAQALCRMKEDNKLDPEPVGKQEALDVDATIQPNNHRERASSLVTLNHDIEIAESISSRRDLGSLATISELGTQGQRKTTVYAPLADTRDLRGGAAARHYRPQHRPPAAVLEVFDDNQSDFELVRIRTSPFCIGREEGDLVIPHETQMSRRHASITRRREDNIYRWYLRDLGSKNGTYIGAQRIALKHEDDLLIGGVVVRFFQPAGPDSASLAKVSKQGCEEQIPLQPGECRIGTDTKRCLNFLSNNPYLDPHHIRIFVDADGRWRVCDEQSSNGVFVRVTEIELRNGWIFHAGEQRFRFRVP